eukprot:363058-Chlamydomonas_euryale.AAC.2
MRIIGETVRSSESRVTGPNMGGPVFNTVCNKLIKLQLSHVAAGKPLISHISCCALSAPPAEGMSVAIEGLSFRVDHKLHIVQPDAGLPANYTFWLIGEGVNRAAKKSCKYWDIPLLHRSAPSPTDCHPFLPAHCRQSKMEIGHTSAERHYTPSSQKTPCRSASEPIAHHHMACTH